MDCPRSNHLAAALLGVGVLLAGCVKPTTFGPYANPGRHELDRLQKIVNERPEISAARES
ncbi:hypothetical protein [Mycobacterium lacus]|uniref:Uncharacterized protein n=1 Tax=Mycobacterium lacus TaxID=169765 RepID=A0A1X1XL23_9MYCO|nr:hypothetical protein [Mycobacterium lacus]ORV99554.1 hypothetical protein AWC15_10375 [Mycobacterium lacus]BBX97898.1 hypothetical protein MLAC_31920 [Mycobacterium lacus]